ncbi:MAG TPA: DUF4838 domain-containing protein [Sumerlaeia bacterium]|nr:DUF4838 domain-containing protein [Sumerlaeia bacterium]
MHGLSSKQLLLATLALCGSGLVGCREAGRLFARPRRAARCQIVIPREPTPVETRAAEELQKYLLEATDVRIPIVGDDHPAKKREIILGRSSRLRDLNVSIDFSKLERDGFSIKTVGEKLIIAGGSERGALYGVYTFLEDVMGCRRFTSDVVVVPKAPDLRIPDIDATQVPAVKVRHTSYRDAKRPEYADWHKLHWDMHENWGMWVHTFHALVPPEEYFNEHPEYFAMVRGERVRNGQLCLTNPELFEVLVASLRKRMDEKPETRYWSVSQNDTGGYCTCPECRAIDEREGSHAGSLIAFINKVAAEFPDKTISTLAYQYSRSAPKTVRPAKNVNVVLCTIECNRSKPIATDPLSESFRKDIEDWGKICDDILVWDYTIQFQSLVSPFPNLRVLQPNIRFFAENSCVAMYQQANREIGGEFHELRAYLIAKILWNPDVDLNAVMDDFLKGYYEDAAPYIREYIDLMHDALEESGETLGIFGNPNTPVNGYLSRRLIERYNALFDKAEAAVAGKPEILQRVQVARLPLDFAMLEQAKRIATGEGGLYEKGNDDEWSVRPEVRERLGRFTALCNKANVSRIHEWSTTPDEYHAGYLRLLEPGLRKHLARGKKVRFATPWSPKYPAGGDDALTNGLKGDLDFNVNWIGFEGTDMEVVIDLEEAQPIRKISAGFLQQTGSWIFLPRSVVYEISSDGKSFATVASLRNSMPEERSGVFIETFAADLTEARARYVRVKAEGVKTCPSWHAGAGGKSWIFVDEIVVE